MLTPQSAPHCIKPWQPGKLISIQQLYPSGALPSTRTTQGRDAHLNVGQHLQDAQADVTSFTAPE